MKKRIEKLMYMGLGALIAFGGYFFGALHSDNVDAQLVPVNVEYDQIRCRSLVVVDPDGNTLLTLGSNLGGGDISIYEGNGELRARLGINSARYSRQADDGRFEPIHGGHLSIYGADAQILISLEADGLGGGLTTYHQNGIKLVSLNHDVRGGNILVHNKTGEPLLDLGVTGEGGGAVWAHHGQRGEAAKVYLHAGPRGGTLRVTGNDSSAINLDIDTYGGRMAVFNKSGENVLQTGVNNAGDGTVLTWDQFGDVTGGFPAGENVKINKRLK